MAATKQTGASKLERLKRSATPTQMLVRLKPYTGKKGNQLQRFTAFGILFEESKGWYKVDAYVADYLKNIRARPADLESQILAFDVCTPAEADKVNTREMDKAILAGKATPKMAQKVVARDVTSASDVGPKVKPPEGFDLTLDDVRPPVREVKERSMRAAKD